MSHPTTPNPPTTPAAPVLPPPAPAVLDEDQLVRLGRSEWLLTNGLGGFAMGTASGIPERRYHAWLVAALTPPVGRVVALHSCVEWLVVERGEGEQKTLDRLELSSFRFAGGTIHPSGSQRLVRFETGAGWCRWWYKFGPITVTRELTMIRGANAVMARYRVAGLTGPAWLEVRPLVGLRDFHNLLREGEVFSASCSTGVCEVGTETGRLRISVLRDGTTPATFTIEPQWWHRFEYPRELERGQDGIEDLYSPGVFIIECDHAPGSAREILLTASTLEREAAFPHRFDEAAAQHERALSLPAHAPAQALADTPELPALLHAADQFIVQRTPLTPGTPPLATVIAGYPWFSDWGRDTFISMRGLLLCTGRYAEALDALLAFAALQRRGLIPNCFDNSGRAEYNTVDASLWFIHAACEYRRVSGDHEGFRSILGACYGVIEAYQQGTDFDIRVESDGLVAAGGVDTQLTWMDARRDGVVFTPRHGKPVEINALWYSCLLELADAVEPDNPRRARALRQLADRAGASFAAAFWCKQENRLADVVTPTREGWKQDLRIRPNQLFAVCQPYSPLTKEQQRAVIQCVREHLLTPVGLRTLSPEDQGYIPRFEGSMRTRDAAYHNGTVWPWLLGPYAEAVMRAGNFSEESRREAREALTPLLRELMARTTQPGPIRQLAEVYDGEDAPTPRRPEGCMAQAWSVAELLRVLTLAGA